MNYIEQVANILGVETGQEFNIVLEDGTKSSYNPFHFTEDGLQAAGEKMDEYLIELLTGIYTIEIPPFKPKIGDDYWYWSVETNYANNTVFYKCDFDIAMCKIGNCFRTKEEAETKGKELMDQLLKEYNNV